MLGFDTANILGGALAGNVGGAIAGSLADNALAKAQRQQAWQAARAAEEARANRTAPRGDGANSPLLNPALTNLGRAFLGWDANQRPQLETNYTDPLGLRGSFLDYTAQGFGNQIQNAFNQMRSLLEGNAARKTAKDLSYLENVAPWEVQGQTQRYLADQNLAGITTQSENERRWREFTAEQQRQALETQAELERRWRELQALSERDVGLEQARREAEWRQFMAEQDRLARERVAQEQRQGMTDVADLERRWREAVAELERATRLGEAQIGKEQALGTSDLERQWREFQAQAQRDAIERQAQLEAAWRQQVAELERQRALQVEQEKTNRSLSVLPAILQAFTGAVAGAPGGFNFGTGDVGVELTPNPIVGYLPK